MKCKRDFNIEITNDDNDVALSTATQDAICESGGDGAELVESDGTHCFISNACDDCIDVSKTKLDLLDQLGGFFRLTSATVEQTTNRVVQVRFFFFVYEFVFR